jgi:hypothetical protein
MGIHAAGRWLALFALAGLAWGFGKNKVQYDAKAWHYLQTGHFDVYYYDGGYEQAAFTADVADSAYRLLVRDYDWELPEGRRITIVTYQSHNDFSNTNLISGVLPESVGGFTEFYKNRVAVPFQGSWEDYRHVIHHELNHAFQLSMFYGESVLQGVIRFPLPLWFVEGTSEYTSRGGWDREANMFMADAVVSGYLPDIPWMGGFLAYKGGQSVFCYIEDEFGRERFGELMHRVRSLRSVERGFEATLGFGVEELSRQWQAYLKSIYWPAIGSRVRAGDFADRITDHLALGNFVNNSPAISPSGDRMVFLSDRTGYFDLYSAHITAPDKPRLLLQGQQSGKFEELHWLRPGIAWSPDETRIYFASKAGDEDELFVIDPVNGRVLDRFAFGLRALHSPTISPDGRWAAFVAQEEARSDIWLLDLELRQTRRVTDDRHGDFDPAFSPDGRWLTFTSDRDDDLGSGFIGSMSERNYAVRELYLADLTRPLAGEGPAELRRLTHSPYDKRTPVWLPALDEARGAVGSPPRLEPAEILFVSDAGGAWNLYSLPGEPATLAGPEPLPLPEKRTEMLTGIFQPSVSRQGKLLFASFENGGYDLFLHKDLRALERLGPMIMDDRAELPFNRLHTRRETAELRLGAPEGLSVDEDQRWRQVDFSRLDAFGGEEFRRWSGRAAPKVQAGDTSLALKPGLQLPRVDEEGNYLPRRYRLRFSPDMSMALAQYDDLFGLQGVSQVVLSDLLGNHHINLYLNFYNRIEFSNIHVYYRYSARRVGFEGGVFRYVHYLEGEVPDRYYRDGLLGADLNAVLPLDRFTRLQWNNRWTTVDRDSLNSRNYSVDSYNNPVYRNFQRGHFLTSGLSWVYDNTLWGSTGPVNGQRGVIGYSRGFPVAWGGDAGNNFHTVEADLRRYLRINNDLQLALRLSAGASWGATPQRFFLGGSRSWINPRYHKSRQDTSTNRLRSEIDELYYAVFAQPMRGTALYQREGDRYAMGNAELRFPILRYLVTGWPLTIGLRNLRGVIFADAGSAWDRAGPFDAVKDGHLEDLLMSYGWGFRVNVGFALLKVDWAWATRWDGNPDGPQVVLTLGTDF